MPFPCELGFILSPYFSKAGTSPTPHTYIVYLYNSQHPPQGRNAVAGTWKHQVLVFLFAFCKGEQSACIRRQHGHWNLRGTWSGPLINATNDILAGVQMIQSCFQGRWLSFSFSFEGTKVRLHPELPVGFLAKGPQSELSLSSTNLKGNTSWNPESCTPQV